MRYITIFLIILAAPALATPRVVTDIAPVHSLAAQVMKGVGEPDLLIQVGASPHGYSLRPSEAQALQDADVVFWIGEALTPQLERSLETLASDADIVELFGAGGSEVLPSRDAALFGRHDEDGDHEEHEDHHDEDGYAKHEEDDHEGHKHNDDHQEHEDHADKDDHGDDHEDHHAHDHGDTDPHAWLDPANARAWLDVIAEKLSAMDPANAAAYAANASAAKMRLDAAEAKISAKLATVKGKEYIVFHDAYQYFEHHFNLPSSGAISIGDARKPSPARIKEIQTYAKSHDIVCVFSEPQFNAGVVDAVFGGTEVRTGVMDPLGVDLIAGSNFYEALIVDLGEAVADCLKG